MMYEQGGVVFIGTTMSSLVLLECLVTQGLRPNYCLTLNSPTVNADYADLGQFCTTNAIEVVPVDGDVKLNVSRALRAIRPDVLFCFGWSYLLSQADLDCCGSSYGFHPSLLPKYGGRHPIIWAMVLGLEHTGVSFFKLTEKADAGALVAQRSLKIDQAWYAQELYDELMILALDALTELINQIKTASVVEICPKYANTGFCMRKRSLKDGIIDWRMNARDIVNLVRGLSQPYPCAEFFCQNLRYKVLRAELAETDLDDVREPGFVIGEDAFGILIQCGGGSVIRLTKIEPCSRLHLVAGDYL